jgi:hypothetical protein
MRSRYVTTQRAPLQLDLPPQPKHAPLLPVLQEVAQRKQMRLQEDLTSRAWSSPQCVLNWTTSKGIGCTFYLVGGPGDFQLDLHCWDGNRLIERKQWRSHSMNATHEVRQVLESVYDWSQTLG